MHKHASYNMSSNVFQLYTLYGEMVQTSLSLISSGLNDPEPKPTIFLFAPSFGYRHVVYQ